jgi:hypothetical protein
MRSGDIGKAFFHTSVFMAVIFAFFLAGCIDFADYVKTPLERHWREALGPDPGSISVTVTVGTAFSLLLPAAVGGLVKKRSAVVSFVLSFVICLAGYIIVWNVLSLAL